MFDRRILLKFFNLYPPYLGAGVRVREDKELPWTYHVSMNLRWFNSNYVGAHFGGSLYSMVDPFYMLILMNKIGSEYVVWDKAAQIHFKRPGKGRVRAYFHIDDQEVEAIKKRVDEDGKAEPVFQVNVLNEDDQVVCEVHKTLWVKRRS